MKDKVSLLPAYTLYICVWVLVAAYVALCELDVLPTAYVAADASLQYTLHMLCVLLTIGCTWGALRLFAFKRVRHRMQRRATVLPAWNILRIVILATAIVVNLAVYYALLDSSTPLYCLLITLVGFVFCLPKKDEIE